MTDGQYLKLSIRGKGLTVEQAAEKLCVTRNTLQVYFRHAILSDEIIQNVLSKLGIDILKGRGSEEISVVKEPKAVYEPRDLRETISYQKELIDSQKEVIAMLKDKVEMLEGKKDKMNIEGAVKEMLKQFPLIMQKIERVEKSVSARV